MTEDAKLLAYRIKVEMTWGFAVIKDQADADLIDAALHAYSERGRSANIKWRSHTEKPDTERMTALLAMPDEEGEHHQPVLLGIYMWWRGRFITEYEGRRAREPYWWVPEDEVVASIAVSSGDAAAAGYESGGGALNDIKASEDLFNG